MAALVQKPHSAQMAASSLVVQTYQSGIITSEACYTGEATDLNHSVLVTGYDATNEYWIVRNSWGSDWGDSGYMRIGMAEAPGICGINTGLVSPNTRAADPWA